MLSVWSDCLTNFKVPNGGIFTNEFFLLLQQLANPRPDDWSKFAKTLAELKNNQTGDDLDQLSISSR